MTAPRTSIAVDAHFLPPAAAEAGCSALALGLSGSEILKIAAQVRAMKAAGRDVCNLTVGDFDPQQFRPPARLLADIGAALQQGATNYPPSDGIPELRAAVVAHYRDELGLLYPQESVLIASGARPILYGAYCCLLDPGDLVVYPVPSWNNNHYVHLAQARAVEIPVTAEDNFFPSPEQLAPHLREARLLVINSPQNPTGTAIEPERLRALTRLIVDENRRRAATGQKALFLLYDQVYWTLTFGETRHVTPVELVPESAPYVVLLDAISKSLAATGLRVGWAVAAPAIIARMRDFLGHVGAWAPKPEQVATAAYLGVGAERREWQAQFRSDLKRRLDLLHQGFAAMARDGLPVRAIEPQGAIYLSAQFDLIGERFQTNEEIRRHLLEAAGLAAVPFQAFGLREETGWFRLSVGAASEAAITAMLPRLRQALA